MIQSVLIKLYDLNLSVLEECIMSLYAQCTVHQESSLQIESLQKNLESRFRCSKSRIVTMYRLNLLWKSMSESTVYSFASRLWKPSDNFSFKKRLRKHGIACIPSISF